MSKIDEYSNNRNTTYVYKLRYVKDKKEGVRWITSIMKYPQIVSKSILVDDIQNSSDEGNNSKQLPPDASTEEILKYTLVGSVELLSIVAKYNNKPVIIGVDFRDMTAYVTIRISEPADISDIEKKLFLLEG